MKENLVIPQKNSLGGGYIGVTVSVGRKPYFVLYRVMALLLIKLLVIFCPYFVRPMSYKPLGGIQ